MTRVDFYVLESGTQDTLFRFICRLTEKAWRKGNRIFMHCQDKSMASKLDKLLWTYRDISFLPHSIIDQQENCPISIGAAVTPSKSYDLLINLDVSVPDFFSRFTRVIETTGVDDQHREFARDRYRFYQQRGYPMETHKISGA